MVPCTIEVEAKFPELVQLIQETDSMDDIERKYWFALLNGNIHNDPKCMTDEQVDHLYEILQNEKIKLAELDSKYNDMIESINEQHLIEWNLGDKSKLSTKNDLSKTETLGVSE